MTIQVDSNDRWRRRIASLRDGYLPPAHLAVSPDLQFHTEYDTEIGPDHV